MAGMYNWNLKKVHKMRMAIPLKLQKLKLLSHVLLSGETNNLWKE